MSSDDDRLQALKAWQDAGMTAAGLSEIERAALLSETRPRKLTVGDYSEAHLGAFERWKAAGYSVAGLSDRDLEALLEDRNFATEVGKERERRVKVVATEASTAAPGQPANDRLRRPMTVSVFYRIWDRLSTEIVQVVKTARDDGLSRVAALEARVAALEARPELRYEGTHDAAKTYRRNSLVTHDGSLWIALQDVTGGRPGSGDAWRLCVKRGRDGRDR